METANGQGKPPVVGGLSAALDPKAEKGRPNLTNGVAPAKALGHRSGAALQER